MVTVPSADEQGGYGVSTSLGSGYSSAGHSGSRRGWLGGERWPSWSQLIVKLILLSQVDPTEDECSQGQCEHHDEDC